MEKSFAKIIFGISLILFPIQSFAGYSALATQEDDVNGTTSNNHKVIQNDWFVALPSPEKLSSDNSWTNRIRLSQVNQAGVTIRTCIAPIWDVGPWNTKDNYWDQDSSRTIYGQLRAYWKPVGSNSAPATATPTGWDPSIFSVPPSIGPGSLAPGTPEADTAFFTSGFYPTYSLSTPLSSDAYNYSSDEVGRHPWCIPCTYTDLSGVTHTSTDNSNQLNGAGIDLADGVFLYGVGFAVNSEPRITWNFTQDLPAISEVQILNQAGVILYDRLYGQSMPATNLLVPPGSPVTLIITFNQSMLEETQDAYQGIPVSTAMPIVQYGSNPSTVKAVGWSATNYGDDTWTGVSTVPTAFSGPQTLSIQSFLSGQTNGVENQLEGDESTSNGYNPRPDTLSVFQVGNPTYVQSVTLSQGPNFNMFYAASWPTTAQGAPPSGPLNVSTNIPLDNHILGSLGVTLGFSGPMDIATGNPIFVFTVAGGTQFPATGTGQWNGQQTWSGTVPASAVSIDYVGPITLQVSGLDSSGNPIYPLPPNIAPAPNTTFNFWIAGLPYAQAVTVKSNGQVMFSDDWAPYSGIGFFLTPNKPVVAVNTPVPFGGIHVDIQYSQPMNTSDPVTVIGIFSDGNYKPFPTGTWSSNKQLYSIDTSPNYISAQEAGDGVTLQINGGFDAADNRPFNGNPSIMYHLLNDGTGKHWGYYDGGSSSQ